MQVFQKINLQSKAKSTIKNLHSKIYPNKTTIQSVCLIISQLINLNLEKNKHKEISQPAADKNLQMFIINSAIDMENHKLKFLQAHTI